MRNSTWLIGLTLCISAPSAAQSGDSDPQAPFAAYEAGRFVEASRAAEARLASDPENTVWWALLAEAQARLDLNQEAAMAFGSAARFETDPAKRSYFLRAQALQLVYADRREEARVIVRAAMDDTLLETRNSLDWAMVAISARDDRSAQDILSNETLYADFTRQTALDAGYSAKRQGLDARAVRFFEAGLALDQSDMAQLSPQEREAIHREVRELERDWSFIAQGSYSTAGRADGLVPLADAEALQLGAEVSRRIGGWRNGKPFSLFARVYHSEFLGDDALTNDATQGWLGVRYKPFSSLNLNVEASRLIGLDAQGIDDWSLRGAISGGEGLEPEVGSSGWNYTHFYGDLSYLIENDVTYGIAEGRYGRAFALGKTSTVLTPYAVVRAGLDTGRVEEGSLGAGLGLTLRHWFDETGTAAYRGFIDFDIQAREQIAGDESASGVLASITVGR